MDYHERPWLKSYDDWVQPDIVIPDLTSIDLMKEAIEAYPDQIACHFLGAALSFPKISDLSYRFADYLTQSGCEPGDVVAINLPNVPQYLIAQAGTMLAGCVATGLSPLLSPKEMTHQLEDSGAKVVITLDAIFEQRLLSIVDRLHSLRLIVVTGVLDFAPGPKRFLGNLLRKVPTGKIRPVEGKSVITLKRLLREYEPTSPSVEISADDTALIQYTGGTTGPSKGAELTHRNLVANLTQAIQWAQLEKGTETFCSAFPFFHLAGLAFALCGLATGSEQVLLPNPRDTRHVCKEIARYRPTVLCNVPSLFQMLLKDPMFKTLDFSACKVCLSGAAPFSVESLQALDSVVGKGKVLEVYGMTETSPLVTMNPHRGTKKPGTVGLPIQNTHVRIVDLIGGQKSVPIGEEGELVVRGPQVMKGYFNKPEETASALREFEGQTWLFTGDVARMDQEGYITLVDRTKDMLIVGGFKVFSQEVEETLQQHPAVEACAIVGLPNPERLGSERVKAVIQLAKGHADTRGEKLTEDILAYCKANMAPYKVPKVVEFMEELPLTAVGKVDKKLLR
jgi:long-chain acyl-CoA synthetase